MLKYYIMRFPQPTSLTLLVSRLVEHFASLVVMVVWEQCVPRLRSRYCPHLRHRCQTLPLVHPKRLRVPGFRNAHALYPF